MYGLEKVLVGNNGSLFYFHYQHLLDIASSFQNTDTYNASVHFWCSPPSTVNFIFPSDGTQLN